MGEEERRGEREEQNYGRQERESPETQVSVAGHIAERVEPEDQGRSQESAEIAV
jgi:hypothetical protein